MGRPFESGQARQFQKEKLMNIKKIISEFENCLKHLKELDDEINEPRCHTCYFIDCRETLERGQIFPCFECNHWDKWRKHES